ncbi:hypothetical protein [Schaalia canis]|uniref:Uncharacterized protein n=1 Tax=Schaalia canis TaxID=100469 RepID=A0A3P1SGY4_9ACTO|nr:hypothetical protein [Schaalia canis]RRC96324.1 hypothetical protein EII11_01340 [Schaalia canis]
MTENSHPHPSTPAERPASPPVWPKVSVAVLSGLIVALLAWHFLPSLNAASGSDRALYDEAVSAYKSAEEDLALAAGEAVKVLRSAQERSDDSTFTAVTEIDELRTLLETEPPAYEAPDTSGLSRDELRAQHEHVETITDEIRTLTHKLSRQAAKVERILKRPS